MANDTAQDKDGVGMSRSQVVAEHLPLLRRYSRALTGSQASGDAYVAAMLEALLQDGSLLDERHGPRAGLFKLFTQIWNSVSLNDNPDVATLALPPERFLTGERPEPAFLISKPFQPAMVSAVASQALFFQRNSRNRAPRAATG